MTDSRSRDLALRWVAAWAHLRRFPVARVDGWPLVTVGTASRETEIVCVDLAGARLARQLERVGGDPRAMLTLLGRDLPHAPVPPDVRVDRDDEVLMSATLDPFRPPPPPPVGYVARWDVDGSRAHLSVEADGGVAAEGWVAVLGSDAVLDRVETADAHRRRGLGRHVVASLSTWAARDGASTGLLAASAEGRRLYASLGWETELRMRSFVGRT